MTLAQMRVDQYGRIYIEGVDPAWIKGSIAGILKEYGWMYGRQEFGREGVWFTRDQGQAAAVARRFPELVPPEIKQRVAQAAEAQEASRATDADIDIPAPAGLAYLPYQKGGIAYSIPRKNVLIGDAMGLGKTIQALGVANKLNSERILVICPAGLRLNWKKEAEKWLVHQPRMYVIQGGKDPMNFDMQMGLFNQAAPVCVMCNYEMLLNERIRKKLLSSRWDLLVFDEAHAVKNPKAARTQYCLGANNQPGLVDRAEKTLFLTGTPILNRPIELYPILAHCMPKRKLRNGHVVPFMSAAQFSSRFCGGDGKGASRLEELQARLRSTCMVRRLKEDVLQDLPAKWRQIITLEPEGEAAEAVKAETERFTKMRGDYLKLQHQVSDYKDSTDRAGYAAMVGKLRAAGTEMLGEIAKLRKATALAKVPYVVEHIRKMIDEEGIKKLILFAYHHEVIDKLHEGLHHFGLVKITGETPLGQRQAAVEKFQADPRVCVFLGNFKAAGVGLTLTAAAHVVFAEIDWTPANICQAEDRAHRIGQKSSVFVQHILLDGSIDERLTRAMVQKQEIADKALDEKTKQDALTESVDLFAIAQ